ncbi:hypothetical protein [Aquabacterium sp.]|uniref:hypothetical protein n=1 Tax=Aquabacterium sp. TaxID=1872578 RepID=UPI00248A7229|nr:hypothetical protein [Aquabacterium sp.]MDI1259737.1 hypothetical protein [Aquabacterium sp.]
MRLKRYWMTGCMALVLMAAGRLPELRDSEDASDSKIGWVTLTSKHSLDDTVSKLMQAARSRGMSVMAKVSPQRPGGQDMSQAPALVLVLGDTDGHTPVVQDTANAEPHLPMKLLVETQRDGSTTVSFHDGATLLSDADIPSEFIGGMRQLPRVVGAAVG